MKLFPSLLLAAAATISVSAYALTTSDMIGESANGATPQRSIAIDGTTRHLNVMQGDTIKLTSGEQSVVWHFDGLDTVIPLARVFPAAPNAQSINVYVEPDHPG
jgi:hypothetical protein